MKRSLGLLILLGFMTLSLGIPAAFAAPPEGRGNDKKPGGGGGNDGGGTASAVGYDVSFPQCGKRLPNDHAFAIVGVNGGNAATGNGCLAEQLAWGDKASGTTNQPHLQLYVNTANPGEVIDQIKTWPTSNVDQDGFTPDNKYGQSCTGDNDLSCSWLYGWNRARAAVHEYFLPAASTAKVSSEVSGYVWWLDVETMNTWQQGSDAAKKRNVAALEGWTSYFNHNGADVGLYSTAYQWGEITGNFIDSESNLNGLPNWRPSGASLNNAITNCGVDSLTSGGFISLTQYVKKNLDHNHSCIS